VASPGLQLYIFDLIGAASAAWISGAWLIPLVGIDRTIIGSSLLVSLAWIVHWILRDGCKTRGHLQKK